MEATNIEHIKNTVLDVLNHLAVPFDRVEVVEEEGEVIRVNIETERAPFLIGSMGARLEALQHLVKNILWKKEIKDCFLILDIDHYKKNREERVLQLGREKAEAVQQTQMTQEMPPLDPYLRRLVHLDLVSVEGIKTESFGEGSRKKIQISPVEE